MFLATQSSQGLLATYEMFELGHGAGAWQRQRKSGGRWQTGGADSKRKLFNNWTWSHEEAIKSNCFLNVWNWYRKQFSTLLWGAHGLNIGIGIGIDIDIGCRPLISRLSIPPFATSISITNVIRNVWESRARASNFEWFRQRPATKAAARVGTGQNHLAPANRLPVRFNIIFQAVAIRYKRLTEPWPQMRRRVNQRMQICFSIGLRPLMRALCPAGDEVGVGVGDGAGVGVMVGIEAGVEGAGAESSNGSVSGWACCRFWLNGMSTFVVWQSSWPAFANGVPNTICGRPRVDTLPALNSVSVASFGSSWSGWWANAMPDQTFQFAGRWNAASFSNTWITSAPKRLLPVIPSGLTWLQFQAAARREY